MWCYKGKGAEGGGTSAQRLKAGRDGGALLHLTQQVRVKYSFYLSLLHLN